MKEWQRISLGATFILCLTGCVNKRSTALHPGSSASPQIHEISQSPFLHYDAEFVGIVEKQWHELLKPLGDNFSTKGQVTVQFRFYKDGSITHLEIVKNSTTESLGLLCLKAIQDSQPFPHWSTDMEKMVDGDYRRIQFSFTYN